MEPKSERIYIRVTATEKRLLKKRAEYYHMTASDFARTLLIHSEDGLVRIVNVEPFRQVLHELTKQGTNLNQLIKFLNTYGAHSYDSVITRSVLRKETEAFEQVANAVIALRKEMAEHGVVLSKEEDEMPQPIRFPTQRRSSSSPGPNPTALQ